MPPPSQPATYPPPPPASQLRRAAAAYLAARGTAAAATGPTAVQLAAAEKGAQAAVLAGDAILQAFARFARQREVGLEEWIAALLDEAVPHRDPTELRTITAEEVARERLFAARTRERLERDIPRALAETTPEARQAAVDRIMERERGYQELRREAMEDRAVARARALDTRDESPRGAVWVLGQRRTHTAGCRHMAARGWWPWSVLDFIHPRVHAGCGCVLVGEQRARRLGLLPADGSLPDTSDVDGRGQMVAELVATLEED